MIKNIHDWFYESPIRRIFIQKQNVDGILQKRQKKKKNLATENNNSKHVTM